MRRTRVMNIWINKNSLDLPDKNFDNAYIFSLNRKGYGTIFTNLSDTWLRLGALSIESIYEDLFIIAISIFAIDKRVSRSKFKDCWTRELKVSFRKTDNQYSLRTKPSRIKLDVTGCDAVCLFSGGLDSFCGAIKLLEQGVSPCLFGHNEYPKLRKKQNGLAAMFREEYKDQTAEFLSFTANSRAPENSENGFIGLNIPLTNSRKGSCSTRTTHPYFLKCFKMILENVGIKNPILNPFAFLTKREIVDSVKNTIAFKRGFADTISCSHPCNRGLNKYGVREYPLNCGYCYPCLIRKSSLLDVNTSSERYWMKDISIKFFNDFSNSDIINDSTAVINSVYRYKYINDDEIRRLIRCTGKLSVEEVNKFLRVYKQTMKDLVELFSSDPLLKEYIGL